MKTTKQWWDEVSSDENKMVDWLKKQYHGELTAENKIRSLIETYNLDGKEKRLITKIADDEKKHAEWVRDLLLSRGIAANILDKEERYWNTVLPTNKTTFSYMCAIGHHAETMRLERIMLLSEDERFIDIAEVFQKIVPDELFHAKAFEYMSTKDDIDKARVLHENGMESIGLVL